MMRLKVLPETVECGSCHEETVTGLVCESCGAIQPRPGVDKFAALGVPRRFGLDGPALEARYRELTRKLHPDRFALAPARARILSLQAATTLNDAYKTLRNPVTRAEYLLELAGLPVEGERAVDPAFLVEMLEAREELAAAKGAEDRPRLARLGVDMQRRLDAALDDVAAGFGEYERWGDPAALERVRGQLVAMRYFQRYLDEVEGREE